MMRVELTEPPELDEYPGFIEELTDQTYNSLEENYNNNVHRWIEEFKQADYYSLLRDNLTNINNDYEEINKVDLINIEQSLEIEHKCFKDMLEKCYRRDVLNNEKWSEEETSWQNGYEWITPLNCFKHISDLVRTRIYVKYIDGATDVLNRLIKIANDLEFKCEHDYIAYESGYYGIHFLLCQPTKYINIYEIEEDIELEIEIQITTQIKEIVNLLLHEYYKLYRMKEQDGEKKWQWDYSSLEFVPNYIGHISHYVEGMILQARQKLKEEPQ